MRDDERRRFARHIALPEIGADGQEALLAARAKIVGADETVRLAATYLAAGGVGSVRYGAGTQRIELFAAQARDVKWEGMVALPDRPDWWPGTDDDTALAYWRAGTAAAEWMLDVARRR